MRAYSSISYSGYIYERFRIVTNRRGLAVASTVGLSVQIDWPANVSVQWCPHQQPTRLSSRPLPPTTQSAVSFLIQSRRR